MLFRSTDKNYKLIEDTDITKADKTIKKKEEKEEDRILEKGTDAEKEQKLPSKKKFDIDYSYVEELKGYKQYILKDPDELKAEKEKFKNTNQNILLPLNQCVLFKFGLPVSPNVDFFGVSKIFSILEISEINREIHYDILPSLNKSQMSGNGIIIAPMIKSADKLKELEGQLEEGANYIVTPSQIGRAHV